MEIESLQKDFAEIGKAMHILNKRIASAKKTIIDLITDPQVKEALDVRFQRSSKAAEIREKAKSRINSAPTGSQGSV